uniref:Uncharacterized protein n=1 Tax=Picea sitchensis TaxID=3332 RepID=A9NQN2_PICSI|nr:unknown [Picea sitchensis]ACN40267.1 unknown [Picea sitchensis]
MSGQGNNVNCSPNNKAPTSTTTLAAIPNSNNNCGQGAIVNCSPNISGPEIGNTQGNQGNKDKQFNNYGDQFNNQVNQGEQFNIQGNRGTQTNIGKKTSHTNNYGGLHGDHGTLKSGGSFNFGK